ncbi:hypothetical protein HWV62_38887, partial [Athelia sp. TMB]
MFNDIINTPITKIICSVKVEKVLNGNTVQVGDGKREIVSVATPVQVENAGNVNDIKVLDGKRDGVVVNAPITVEYTLDGNVVNFLKRGDHLDGVDVNVPVSSPRAVTVKNVLSGNEITVGGRDLVSAKIPVTVEYSIDNNNIGVLKRGGDHDDISVDAPS